MSHVKPTNALFADLEGFQFGRLTVIGFEGRVPKPSHGFFWSCRCECGTVITVRSVNLSSGHTQSCGCLLSDITVARNTTHGQAKTPLYARWCTILARCTNPKVKSYANYGGRGIRICQRYASSYEAFRDDMGDPPTPHDTIDRRENNGHYSCGKCDECQENGWPFNLHWASRTHQARNRRSTAYLTFDGRTLPVTEWAEITGVPYHSIRHRLKAGWSIEEALNTPIRPHR